jgi:hypothetical protein
MFQDDNFTIRLIESLGSEHYFRLNNGSINEILSNYVATKQKLTNKMHFN